NASAFAWRYGPWAIVTGASSGIGAEFARALAERGVHLIVTARREALLESLAAELRAAHGVEVRAVALDLAQRDFIATLMKECAGLDVGLVVSNAGFGLKGEHHRLEAAALDAMLDVNCRAPMLLAHAFAPSLARRGRGGMIFTGSIEGFLGFPW